MSEDNCCVRCHARLAADAPLGLCPTCLLQHGLDSNSGSEDGLGQSQIGAFNAHTLKELAPHFPDLEILEVLGQGGMGVVYKAKQKTLDRIVALKILGGQAGTGPEFAVRFSREARAMAILNHPHIVTVYDFGQSHGLYYFLMEFVDGLNLRQLMERGGLTPKDALAIVPQICDALQYAHDKGVVHRDIKPANILLDKNGQVKIADFGLAKLMGQDPKNATLTGKGHVMGTPQYMAPEQLEHPLDVDHRADIYSLGVVFYQMLTGELPIGRFAVPSRKVQVDVRLDEIVLRALEKEPELRFQQASQVKSEVETVMTTKPAAESLPTNVRQLALGPAIGLLVTGILNTLVALVFGMIPIVYALSGDAMIPVAIFVFAMVLISLTLSGFIIFAAQKMMKLENYSLAVAASIVAILLSPGSLIGLAIGIWSLIILNRSDVHAAFATGKLKPSPQVPVKSREKRLGTISLVSIVSAFPITWLLAIFPAASFATTIMPFFLMLLIALICGILGCRTVTGKIGMSLSTLVLILGFFLVFMVGFTHSHPRITTVEVIKMPPAMGTARIRASDVSLDDLSEVLKDFRYGIWNKPIGHFARNRRPDTGFALIDLSPNVEDRWVDPLTLGLPANATGEELAAKVDQGDLYVPDLDHLVPVRGTMLAPLKCRTLSHSETAFDQSTLRYVLEFYRSRREIADAIVQYDNAHPAVQDKWVRLEDGHRYGALRRNGMLVLITAYGEGDMKSVQLIPVGKVDLPDK